MPVGSTGYTRFATLLRESETDKEMWRSGRILGNVVIEKGMRPFPDRKATYEVVWIYEHEEPLPLEDIVEIAAEQADI